jgi:hypothetical protein
MKKKYFEDLVTEARSIDLIEFSLSLVLLFILTFLIKVLYEKKSKAIGGKREFSSLFFIFSVSIFLIFSIIKSSLVLSLGLVGALSVVRFRNAIKDTEQVMYLLLLIAISISISANQYLILLLTILFFFIYIISRDLFKRNFDKIYFFNFSIDNKEALFEIMEYLKDKKFQINNLNQSAEKLQMTLSIGLADEKELQQFLKYFEQFSSEIRISKEVF